ncbi:hypothetical protein BC828DRAFT_43651, partial [Blastocladiella britannica]
SYSPIFPWQASLEFYLQTVFSAQPCVSNGDTTSADLLSLPARKKKRVPIVMSTLPPCLPLPHSWLALPSPTSLVLSPSSQVSVLRRRVPLTLPPPLPPLPPVVLSASTMKVGPSMVSAVPQSALLSLSSASPSSLSRVPSVLAAFPRSGWVKAAAAAAVVSASAASTSFSRRHVGTAGVRSARRRRSSSMDDPAAASGIAAANRLGAESTLPLFFMPAFAPAVVDCGHNEGVPWLLARSSSLSFAVASGSGSGLGYAPGSGATGAAAGGSGGSGSSSSARGSFPTVVRQSRYSGPDPFSRPPALVFNHFGTGFAKRSAVAIPGGLAGTVSSWRAHAAGEDAFFTRFNAMGVGDGVGGWKGQG